MAIRFLCPFGHHLVVPDNRAGKKGRCPECQQKVIVPVPNPVSSKQVQAAQAAGKQEEKEDLDPWDAFVDDLIGADRTPGGQQLGFDTEMLPPPVNSPAKKPSPPTPKSSSKDNPPTPPAAPKASPSKPAAPQQVAVPQPPAPQPPAPQPPAPKPRQSVPVPPPPPRRSNPPSASMAQAEEPQQHDQNLVEPRKVEPRLQGYRPDRDSLHTVHWLAIVLALVTAFSAMPVVQHWNLAVAPVWAQVVWLLVVCQLVYIAWLVSLPDWSTAWMGVLVFTPIAAIYCGVMAIALATPLGKTLVLDLADVRDLAAGWSAANMMLMALMSFACGRVGSRWHRRVSRLPHSLRGTSAITTTSSSNLTNSAWSAV